MDGLKVTAGIALFGVAWLVDVMLDSDDDDDYWSPRAQADRNLNQWIDDRDRWLGID